MRDFWKLNEDVVFKRAKGKILWQPRIDCWISDKIFETGHLPGEYDGLSKPEIYKKLMCSARPYEYNECFAPVFSSNIKTYSKQDGMITENYIETPKGTLKQIVSKTDSSWASLVKKEWVCDENDLKIMQYVEENCDWIWNQEHYEKMQAEWGRLGAPCVFIPRVSMQRLFIDLMGVEQAIYTVYDYPEVVESYFKALHESQFRLLDVINKSPINLINFGDNIHSGTLSPDLFRDYVLEEYQQRCEKLHQADKFVYSHFDGDNQGLMEFYKETGLDGIEAITPKPQGDVTLEEVKEHLGDMFLVDGIPAVYFDETYSEDVLIKCVEKIIELFAPNLVLGISDEISSTGDIERVKLVGKIVDKYNAQFD